MDINADYVKSVLDYDALTGQFRWTKSHQRSLIGKTTGTPLKTGYIALTIKNKQYKAHRVAWLYMFGSWPDGDIDHINGVKSDNRIANLRIAVGSLNAENIRSASANSTTQLLGVSYRTCKRKYRATITVSKKTIHLGYFDSADAAHAVYLEAKRQLHAGCTI
jgi:hypothetical protein